MNPSTKSKAHLYRMLPSAGTRGMKSRKSFAAATLTSTLLLAACGGGASGDETGVPGASTPAPAGAPLTAQRIAYATAPPRFTHVLAWAQATTLTATAPAAAATVEIDFMRLIEENPGDGSLKVVAELGFDHDRPGCDGVGCEGANYVRTPWYGAGGASVAMGNAVIAGGRLQIDLARVPDRIAHWWTPRVAVKPGMRYLVESSYRVSGKAALEFGVDYWVGAATYYNGYDATCASSNNCEAFVSDWAGDTSGAFVTRTVPRY